ncbi:MAG: signal peptidase II [Clostridia bacterium]|nr:signal peptidase II [Clostridia bacterium]
MLIWLTALIVLALDQISKSWMYHGFVVGQLGYSGSAADLNALKSFLASVAGKNSIPENGSWIELSFTANDAALFGLGGGISWASRLLAALTAVFVFLLLFFAVRTAKKLPKYSAVVFGLLLGGSIGNLIDRVALGYVRDMIYVKLIDFPVFNIADSAICIAIGLLVIETLFLKRDGLFDLVEDDVRYLFRLQTRQEAEAKEKARKASRLSRFEEEIPDDEPAQKPEQTGKTAESSDPSKQA